MNARVPDLYIIGAQKAGTTTLFDWLAQHPEIYAHAYAKDYPYFSKDNVFEEGRDTFLSFCRDAQLHNPILGGDANAMYASSGPKRLHGTIPNAKLLVTLRNPINRSYSAYCHAVERVLEKRSFANAIHNELSGLKYKPEEARSKDYIAHGLYAQQLNKIFRYYTKDRVKIVVLEELKENPSMILSEVFNFIGIDRFFIPEMGIKNLTKGGSRSKLLAKILHRRTTSKLVSKLLKLILPFPIRTNIRRKLTSINRVEQDKPTFPPHTRQLLEDYFTDEIKALEEILGRRIVSWHD